jgi:hypothetical protein
MSSFLHDHAKILQKKPLFGTFSRGPCAGRAANRSRAGETILNRACRGHKVEDKRRLSCAPRPANGMFFPHVIGCFSMPSATSGNSGKTKLKIRVSPIDLYLHLIHTYAEDIFFPVTKEQEFFLFSSTCICGFNSPLSGLSRQLNRLLRSTDNCRILQRSCIRHDS